MNYLKDILSRCNLQDITNFILYGSEVFNVDCSDINKSIKSVNKQLEEWLEKEFPETDKNDEAGNQIYRITAILENTYTQIGILIGLALMSEINKFPK